MFIEILEQRIAPAGLVLVDYDEKTGVLTLEGDGAANLFSITKAVSGKGYRLEGDGTDIDTAGASAMDLPKLTAVTIKGMGGDDSISLLNTALTSLDLETGGGIVTLENVTVSGAFSFKGNTAPVTLVVSGGSFKVGQDASIQSTTALGVTMNPTTLAIKGHLGIVGSGENDSLDLTASKSITIGKGVSFESGNGTDSLRIAAGGIAFPGLTTTGSLSLGKAADGLSLSAVGGSTGSDLSVEISAAATLKLAGAVKFTAGTDQGDDGQGGGLADNKLSISAGTLTIGGKTADGNSVDYLGGTAGDQVSITATKTAKLAGGFRVNAGTGDDTVSITGTNTLSIGKNLSGTSLDFTGPSGTDKFSAAGNTVSLAGNIVMKSGTGGPATANDDTNLTLAATKSFKVGAVSGRSIIVEGSRNIDTLSIGTPSLTLIGGISFDGQGVDATDGPEDSIFLLAEKSAKIGASTDTGTSVRLTSGGTFTIAGLGGSAGSFSTKGSFDLTGTSDNDAGFAIVASKVTIGKNKAGFSIDLQGGAQGDGFSILAPSTSFAGTISMAGGAGNDTATIHASTLKGKAIDLSLGDGDDVVDFQASGTVAGDFKVDLGSSTVAGDQSAKIQSSELFPNKPLNINGAFSVLAATESTGLTVLDALHLSVKAATLISLGEGRSKIALSALNLKGNLTVTGGAATDLLEFEREATGSRSRVAGTTTINLGLGDDAALIGGSATDSGVDFLGAVTIDDAGGAADTINADILTANKFKITPGINNDAFETKQ